MGQNIQKPHLKYVNNTPTGNEGCNINDKGEYLLFPRRSTRKSNAYVSLRLNIDRCDPHKSRSLSWRRRSPSRPHQNNNKKHKDSTSRTRGCSSNDRSISHNDCHSSSSKSISNGATHFLNFLRDLLCHIILK